MCMVYCWVYLIRRLWDVYLATWTCPNKKKQAVPLAYHHVSLIKLYGNMIFLGLYYNYWSI